ncbi:MAG: DMT family transporter [Candidatus Acidiferrales bacterium]
MTVPGSRRLQADLALALCTVFWGATFVIVKSALTNASVFVFMALRFSLAALIMAVIHRRALRAITRDEFWAGVQIGALMFGGYVFQTIGLLTSTPTNAAFITGAGVVLVPILLALFWRRRSNAWLWAGALAALAGLYFLTVPPAGLKGLVVGDVLCFGCAVAFALHIIAVGFYSRHHSVGALSFLQVATTAVFSAIAVPVLSLTRLQSAWVHWNGGLLGAVLTTAVLATAVAFSIQVWGQRYTTATHAAILFALEPVFAAVTSFLVIGERWGARSISGAALILLGIVLAELKGPAPASPDSLA